MFGPKYMVTTKNGLQILLRPFKKSEMEKVADQMSSPAVSMWTGRVAGLVAEDEHAWYEKTRESKDSYHWCISVDGQCIGVTGLHEINNLQHSAISGIIIFDKAWWGQGIASATHIARTAFAANTLNVAYIKSTVFVENEASRKALEKVGYAVTARLMCEYFRDGSYKDLYRLQWFNPAYLQVLFPNGIPQELATAIERAKNTLELAKTRVIAL